MGEHDIAAPLPSLPKPVFQGIESVEPYESDGSDLPQGKKGITLAGVSRALKRYWWMTAVASLAGAGAGYVVWRKMDPEFVAE